MGAQLLLSYCRESNYPIMMLISFSLLFISTLTIGHNIKTIHNLNLFRKCNPDICWGKCASIPGPMLAAIIRSEIQSKFK